MATVNKDYERIKQQKTKLISELTTQLSKAQRELGLAAAITEEVLAASSDEDYFEDMMAKLNDMDDDVQDLLDEIKRYTDNIKKAKTHQVYGPNGKLVNVTIPKR